MDTDKLAADFRRLDADCFQFPYPAFGQLDILQWIAFQRLHGMNHMQQIEKNKADAAYLEA